MSDTLILNADFLPLSVVPFSALTWQEAIKAEWLERADVVSEYETWIVRSPSIEMKVPTILRLREFVKIARKVKFSRYNLYLRDEFKCRYCGDDYSGRPHELTMDHVIPRKGGGKTSWTNLVAACPDCNVKKSHYDKMKPAYNPYCPDYWELVAKRKRFPITVSHPSWLPFIDWESSLVAVKR